MRLLRWWWRRPARLRPASRLAVAVILAATALLSIAGGSARGGGVNPSRSQPGIQDWGVPRSQLIAEGKQLFQETCSSCHGKDLRGLDGRGANLRGVGERTADFYVRTGRMPLADPEKQPRRSDSPYSPRQQDALIAYVASFGGPPVPPVDAAKGEVGRGAQVFGEYCMGCHQVVGQGGITTTGIAPDLQAARPEDVAEAVKVAPYVMPYFGQLTKDDVDSLAAYVNYTKNPDDVGGWGIGHIGPIPEGIVAWLLAGFALLLTIRIIGERTTQ